ncbi:MAG: hypothetical protein EOM85_02450, partial [Candidatus Moranbacteria bacterium]|nr:hypothetical protein [Candidatus Moranbacteria bacterium]
NNIAASSSVTTNYPTSGSTAGSGLSGSSVSYAIPYGATDFYLYNNSILLATATATASCASGTTWSGTVCSASTVAITGVTISGSPTVGQTLTSSVSPSGATVSYQWKSATTSNGTYGNITGATSSSLSLSSALAGKYIKLTVTGTGNYTGSATSSYIGPIINMTGTLSATSCTIASGASTCSTSLSWSVTNPVSTTSVTTNYPSSGSVAGTGNSGSGVSYTVTYGSTDFYLYNNAILLSTATATASCASGTTWSGSSCATATASASITAQDCYIIDLGYSNCNATVNWTSTGLSSPSFKENSTVLSNDSSGSVSRLLDGYGKYYYVYDNTTKITSKKVTGICSVGEWDGQVCVPNFDNYIIGTDCTVAATNSSCISEVSWYLYGGWDTVMRAKKNNVTFSSYSSATKYNLSINPGESPVTLSLYSDDVFKYSYEVEATCESGTSWNGSACVAYKTLTVTNSGSGSGTVTSSPSGISCGSTCQASYASGTSVTLTATPSAGGYVFSGWSGACTGTNSTCTVTMSAAKSVTATFNPVTVSVTPTTTAYYSAASSSQTFSFTPTTNYGTTQCRLLNSSSVGITSYASVTSISYTLPSTAGVYGYYIQCRNTTYTTRVGTSPLVAVYVVSVSVSATTPYNAQPGTSVSFTYTPTTNAGTTECALLDNSLTALTAYQGSSPIVYTIPSAIGSYGYYIKCRHSSATSVVATSSLITVNTACNTGSTWNGTSCVAPSGTLSATNCSISEGNNMCDTSLTWSTSYPINTSAVTTSYPSSNTIVSSQNSGTVNYTIPYGSTDFYLYNNSVQLDQKTATASCASGTVWNNDEDICESTTGTLNTTGCIISSGGSSCSTTINWEIFNPVVSTTSLKDLTSNTIIKTISTAENISSMSYSIPAGARSFSLIHNGETIAESSAVATCASQTEWNGSLCELTSPNIETFVASPSSVVKGRSTVLTWESDPDAVCVGTNFDTGGTASGSVSVSPLVTTTYTLTCSRGTHSTVNEITVKAIDMYIKEQ